LHQSYAAKEIDLKSHEDKLEQKAAQIQALEEELAAIKKEREMESANSNKQVDRISQWLSVANSSKQVDRISQW
jgi:hypothetical protein